MDTLGLVKIMCGELTDPQEAMTAWHIKNMSFVGVARAIGSTRLYPCVRRGKGPFSIIDAAGYEQFAAPNSCRGVWPTPASK